MNDPGETHYDPVEAGAVCHDECAIALIASLRADCDALRRERDDDAREIATAPKNERVLVFGRYEDGREEFAMGWLDVCDGCWYYAPQGGLIQGWTPTHWMPLPPPPMQEGG